MSSLWLYISTVFCIIRIASSRSIFDIFSQRQEYGKSMPPEAFLRTDQLIKKHGFESERHFVTTEDGYIIQMHRIVRENSQPFLLMHGLEDSSSGYIITGPKYGLGYLLNNLGYDVWLGNARGNRYSRNHTQLDPNQAKFWDYSWHEIGIYDLPAMIDYILEQTGYERVQYIGHSQGTTSFFVMCSKKPEYNKKVALMQAFAPAAFMKRIPGIPHRMSAGNNEMMIGILESLGIYELPPNGHHGMGYCLESPVIRMVCEDLIMSLGGSADNLYNNSMTPLLVGHVPAGASTKQFAHYGQIINSGRFREFDYGRQINLKKYRHPEPPDYKLDKCSVPVVLHYGYSDVFIHPDDVDIVYHKLGNCIGKYLVPLKEFNHLDFLLGTGVKKLLYDKVFEILRKFDEGTLKKVIE